MASHSVRLFTCLIANLSYSSCLLILTRFMQFMGFGSKEMTSVSDFFVCMYACMFVCFNFFLARAVEKRLADLF